MKSKPKRPPVPEPEITPAGKAKNVTAAAALTGLPVIAIQRARDMACPAFKDNNNIDCEMLLNFVAEHPDITEGLDHSMDPRVQKTWDTFESRMGKRQKRLIAAKHLISSEVLRLAWSRNVIACKTKLYQMENSAAVEIGMKFGFSSEQVSAVKEILMKHNRAGIKELHVGELGKTECPHCKNEI